MSVRAECAPRSIHTCTGSVLSSAAVLIHSICQIVCASEHPAKLLATLLVHYTIWDGVLRRYSSPLGVPG